MTPLIPYNRALAALCNRSTGFSWPAFVLPPSFQPEEAPMAEATAVRKLLRLHLADDTPVVLCLGILNAVPWLRDALEDKVVSYAMETYRPAAATMSGGTLTASKDGPPRVRCTPTEWPAPAVFTLRYHSSETIEMFWGARPTTRFLPFTTLADGRLQVTWPAELDFSGLVAPDVAWAPGSVIHLTCSPGLPTPGVIQKLASHSSSLLLIERMRMAEVYNRMQAPHERLACVLAALALSNRAVYPEDLARFA